MKARLKNYTKRFGIKAVSGAQVSPDMLAKINRYVVKDGGLLEGEVFVRKILLAHNGVDRDRERFPQDLLEDFASTLPGKSLLIGHDRSGTAEGLFFDAVTEEITPEKFLELTGEKLSLPAGQKTGKVLWSWYYLLAEPFNEKIIKNIDAGIYRHYSIGFRATDWVAVKGEYDQVLYWEYVAPGEAVEGSIVWLGAQPGATVQKNHNNEPEKEGGNDTMDAIKTLLAALGTILGAKDLSQENVIDCIKAALQEKDTRIQDLEKQLDEQKSLAADGKAWREDLVKTYVSLKAKLGEVAETPEAQSGLKTVAQGYPIKFLQTEVGHLQKRVEEKFPAEGQLEGDISRGKSADGKTDEPGKKWAGKENPLIPTE